MELRKTLTVRRGPDEDRDRHLVAGGEEAALYLDGLFLGSVEGSEDGAHLGTGHLALEFRALKDS